MANPVLAEAGTTPWANDIHNWRAGDADWLQSRSVLRWASASARGLANASYRADGSIGYLLDVDQYVARVNGVDQKFFFTNYLTLSVDTASAVNLKLVGGTVGVQMEANKVSVTGLGTGGTSFEAGRLNVTNTAVNIVNADATTIALTKDTGAGGLRVAGPITITGAAVLNSTLAVTGQVTVSALTASGAVSLTGGLTVTGGAITASLLGNVTGNVTSTSSKFGNITISGNTVANGTNNVNISDTAGIVLKTTGAMRTKIDDGSTFTAQAASVVVSNVAPTTEDYPDGCLWVQV